MQLSDILRVISLACNGRAIPQIIKKFLTEKRKVQFQNRCNIFSLVSYKKYTILFLEVLIYIGMN